MKPSLKKLVALCLAGTSLLALAACGSHDPINLLRDKEEDTRVVSLYSPMEKTDPDAENVARSASEKTILMAEEQLGVKIEYITYTAEDYQDKTYDDVAIDRIRSHMDDLYLLNPDVILKAGAEGNLADLSGLDCVKNLRDVVKTANTVNGKLVAIPQEVVAYGLFINKDI